METRSYIKHLKISPKKLRFVAANLSDLSPSYALATLSNMPGRAPKILFKAIKSAIDNGAGLKLDQNNLKFKTLVVEQGTFLKRMRPGSKGRGMPYKHRTSHIKVILETKDIKNSLKKTEKK